MGAFISFGVRPKSHPSNAPSFSSFVSVNSNMTDLHRYVRLRLLNAPQIDASSLISASVMAAPCALAISKLSYPETEESKFTSEQNIKVACGYVFLCFVCMCMCLPFTECIPLHFVVYIVDFLWFILGCLNSPVMNRTFWKQLAVEHLHQYALLLI